MGEKIVVGPINRGLKSDREAFVIDNDSFPTLVNAYQWRGRVKRKRGTSLLGRLSRFLAITDGSGNRVVTITPQPISSGISTFVIGSDIFVDPGGASPVNLVTNSTTGSATLNRTTGVLTITTSQPTTAIIYYPTLPVMGLEDLAINANQFPGTLAFDTRYSYNILTASPFSIYDVSFYNNPATGTYAGYVQKGTWTRTSWNGQDYQQFWTVNYQGALWATNGIALLNGVFSPTNVGMQFAPANTITYVSNTATTITLTITGSPLVIGDFVFLNEWAGTNSNTLNFQSGYVTQITPNIIITLPNATLGAGPYTPGIVQYLTNRSDTKKDCLRWYNGDPTTGNPNNQLFATGHGWVNFMPPLSQSSFSIADLPPRQYYLVGARLIVPFKDRLLFFGAVVQASTGNPIYLQDTIVYSQNGTPYYTASFTPNPDITSATTTFNPILVPDNQIATASAYFSDSTGFGGFLTAGISQDITSASSNEDVLIVGFNFLQARLVYTGNDVVPFNLFVINSELGTGSTFSTINMDQGVMTRGSRGFIITNQTSAQRIDLDIPDQSFQISNVENGTERMCAQRDFIQEWVYFTYPVNNDNSAYKFPNQTLQYNYRDNSWAIFNECYTTYGTFRKQDGFIWSTVGNTFSTWSRWNEPWDAGSSTLLEPTVIGGNQQGFILLRDDGTDEGNSLAIQNISGSTVTSPNHSLNNGDYIVISNVNGTMGAQVNGKVFSVQSTTANTFSLSPSIDVATYEGSGFIKRLYIPFIQTKQFPVSWGMAKKTRIGPQQYLLTGTANSQIQLLIFLSQNQNSNPALAYNAGNILPDPNTINDSLVYSSVLYTCPESTNLGLTPANTNLQMIVNSSTGTTTQQQIWHRMNTSLIGDTVQIGFTLSDAQMRLLTTTGTAFAITGATKAYPCVLTCSGNFNPNQLITITNVQGMTQLNDKTFIVISSTTTEVTINADSSTFDTYDSGGTATPVAQINQTAEIELHAMILDVSPSMVLA
jgi:hypothetical protein